MMIFQPLPPEPDDLPAAVVPALVALKHGLRRALRYEATEAEALALARMADRDGLCAAGGSRSRWEPWRRLFYLARTEETIEALLAAERRDPVEEGSLYGYPACCVDAFLRSRPWPADAEPNLPLRAWHRTTCAPFPELNILLWYVDDRRTPYYLISHFPCSFECTASLAYARALRELLDTERPALARQLDAYLALPILLFDQKGNAWDENNGYVFHGRCVENEIHYTEFTSLRTSRSPEPFCRGDRLVNEASRIVVFRGDEPVGTVATGPDLEAHILCFDTGRKGAMDPGGMS
jgi:hypothetical protein